MLEYALLSLYALAVGMLAAKRFSWALGLFIVALPTYLVRFTVGPLPSTLLEVTWGALVFAWLVVYARLDWPHFLVHVKKNRFLWMGIGIFFITSLAGVVVSDMVLLSLGQWRAYFLEPLILFVIAVARSRTLSRNDLIVPLLISTLSLSLYAIFQKFTGIGIATPEWTAVATRRVTAFYTSPNAVALYLAPLVPLAGALAFSEFRAKKKYRAIAAAAVMAASLAAIAFTFSQGAWIALGVGLLLSLALKGYKKIVAGIVVFGLVGAAMIVFFPNNLPIHYKSAGNRLVLWGYSETFLFRSPQNFILGAGVRQFFRKVQKPYYDVKVMERLIYPHNILLNFWTETGLFGMLSFAYIYGYLVWLSVHVYRKKERLWGAGLFVMLTILFVHGLIDVPYFKNDLAMLFWILAALIVHERER